MLQCEFFRQDSEECGHPVVRQYQSLPFYQCYVVRGLHACPKVKFSRSKEQIIADSTEDVI